MKHLMMDVEGIKRNLISMDEINEIINNAICNLNLEAIMPVENIPYYYCDNPNDGGISSYCLLNGGHITIHCFPFYGVCYIDIMADNIDEDKANEFFTKELNSNQITKWTVDRDNEKLDKPYSPETDFGPHLFSVATPDKPFGISECYSALECIPKRIDMHPITRPRVITNKTNNYDIVSGIILIAESHISIHSNIKTGKLYFDIYSCKFCPIEKLKSVVSDYFGTDYSIQLISRGLKPSKTICDSFSKSYNGWKENIL